MQIDITSDLQILTLRNDLDYTCPCTITILIVFPGIFIRFAPVCILHVEPEGIEYYIISQMEACFAEQTCSEQ